ncbi:uncharacterized protein [Amphiura filiformis]|uniref:uncharacterized protein n=1 Tax=Amphiura filiformis TaxID=82378 RepID=UPI003B20EFF2
MERGSGRGWGTVKSSVYRDVRANKVVIESAEQFATYADSTLGIHVSFTPADSIAVFDIDPVVKVPGMQTVHYVEHKISDDGVCELHLFKNSQFQAPGAEPRIGTASYDFSQLSATYTPYVQADSQDEPGTSGSAATNDDDDSDSDSDTGRNSENGEDSDTAMDDTETSEAEENSDSDRDNDDDDDDKTENTCRPVCGDFVAVILVGKKQKKLYVAQVTDITPLPEDFEECVQLKYMEAVNNDGMVYRWARDDDYSREPLPSIIAVLDHPTAVQGSATRETFTFNMKAVLEKFKQT